MVKMCDPELREQTVNQFVKDSNIASYRDGIQYSQVAFAAVDTQLKEEQSRKEFVDKKFQDNLAFISNVMGAEIAEQFLNLYMLEYQQELNTDIAEEMQRLIEQMVEQQEGIQQANAALFSEEQKAALDRLASDALNNAIQKIGLEIGLLDTKIAIAVTNWGGNTWKEGQLEQTKNIVSEFGNDFKDMMKFDSRSTAEKATITKAIEDSKSELQDRLTAMADPETVQTKLRQSYEQANAAAEKASQAAVPDAPAMTAPDAPPMAPPLIQMPPPKSHVINHTAVMAEFACFNMARQLRDELAKNFPKDDSLKKMDIKSLVKHGASEGTLSKYQDKLKEYGKLCDLNPHKKELQSVAEKLTTLTETKRAENSNSNTPRMSPPK
jgi:hypothetical protein